MSRYVLWLYSALLVVLVALLLSPPGYDSISPAKSLAIPVPRVLLLTAHPDDECMFFAPTILALQRADIEVFSLCLSTGNADGLGSVRKSELEGSLDILGISPGKRWAIDHPYVYPIKYPTILSINRISVICKTALLQLGIQR